MLQRRVAATSSSLGSHLTVPTTCLASTLRCSHRRPESHNSVRAGSALLHRWQGPLSPARPLLHVVVASLKEGDSGSSRGSSTQPDGQEDSMSDEEEGETFTRYCFEGLLSSALIVGLANLLGQSSGWSWDVPADGLSTVLACALVPTLMLLAICVPAYPAGEVSSDNKFLEDVYKRSASLTIVIGGDDEKTRDLTLRPSVTPQSISSALALIQTFLARPWSTSRPLPIAGFILKQTMTQAALECLLRGTLVLGLQGVVKDAVAQADSSSWLFWIKFFGLANNSSSLAAAVLLATLLLTPFTLIQTKAVQEFARAAVNKPFRDQGITAMQSAKTVAEFSEKLQSLSKSTGVQPAAFSALLADGPFLPPAASAKQGETEGPEGAAVAGADALAAAAAPQALAAEEGAPASTSSRPPSSSSQAAGDAGASASTALSSTVLSKEAQKQLQRAESDTTAAYGALQASRSPEEAQASALALLDAATASGEAALAVLVETSIAREGAAAELSEQTIAAMASVQALRTAQRRMRAAAVAAETEAELAGTEDARASEFEALSKVPTQEDRLVAQLLGTHLMSCMVAVNVAFLASGSLAVSFGTAWMVRVLPALIVEVTRQLKQDAMQGQGRA